jgi:hypothetical protein
MYARVVFCFWLAACSSTPLPLVAQLPAPELLSLGSLGGQADSVAKSLEKATGALLASTTATSLPALESVTNGSRSPVGLVPVLARSEWGLSNSRLFFLTQEPWTIAVGNESESKATPVEIGHYYQDECVERGRNYYRIRVEQDQRVRVHSFARSLDSRARLQLSITQISTPYDTKTLASSSASIDRDAVLECDLRGNVDYLLIVADHLFRGGPEYRYALTLKNVVSPADATQTPPAVILEQWRDAAKLLDRLQSQESQSPLDPRFLYPRCSMLRPPEPEATTSLHVESAKSEQPISISWPAQISGAFESNNDVDAFDIECEKDVNVAVEVVSQRLGELCDSLLVVDRLENPGQTDEKRIRIADNDDLPSVGNGEMRFLIKDSSLVFKPPISGRYRITVRNLQRNADAASRPSYVLEIRRPNPGYVLATHWTHPIRDLDQTKLTSSTLSTGGAMLLSVHALRFDGFSLPIDFHSKGLPNSMRGGKGIIAADQSMATVTLWHDEKVSTENDGNTVHRFVLSGSARASSDSAPIEKIATPLEVTWNGIDTFRSPLSRVTSSLALYRPHQRVCPLSVQLGDDATAAAADGFLTGIRGQVLKVPVRITRRPGGEAAVLTVRLRQAPTRATAPELKIEAKANEGTWDLQIPKDAPVGDYMLCALVEAAVSVPNTDAAAKDKNVNLTLQLPSTSVRIRIGDNP